MKKEILDKYKDRSDVIKALAHPARLFMLDYLSDGEKCVCKFTEELGLDQSTVSKHLAVLKNSGLVDFEKRGLNVYYRLKCPCIMNIFGCIETVNKSEK
ncbi:MAG TPA: metalloregulator ArsR/SmtB family transcription factor [Candidatus Gastranaerophilales bacterium]|nr:metalloregulator ArsR/SmtB family transcription factor [Candidatus Gastranaerophilales bacterium]